MAPAIGMQMRLVLLGLSSGLQLDQHRYAWKVNQMAWKGGGGVDFYWLTSLDSVSNDKYQQKTPKSLTTNGQLINNTLFTDFFGS